jgi:hypothetical protein
VTVKPRLKGLDSPDMPEDPSRPGFLMGLEEYQPPDPRSFQLRVDAEIGADDGEGADIFSFMVTTPDSAVSRSMGQGPESYAWRNRILYVREWSFEHLVRIVSDLLARSDGSDWQAVAARLGPFMRWEFED